MNNYQVRWKNVEYGVSYVLAENEEEAKQKAPATLNDESFEVWDAEPPVWQIDSIELDEEDVED